MASLRVIVMATPPVAEFSQSWTNQINWKNVRCRYYSLEKRAGTWEFSNVAPPDRAGLLSTEFARSDFYFASGQDMLGGQEGGGVPHQLPKRLLEFITPRPLDDLQWGERIHIKLSGIRAVSRDNKVDLSDPENVISSYVSASRAGDLDWLLSFKDEQDQQAMRKFMGDPGLLKILREMGIARAESFEVFAVARAQSPDDMFIVAFASKAPGDLRGTLGLGLTTIPFRLVAGKWASSEERDRALVNAFNRVCQAPFLLWQSERATAGLSDASAK